MHQTTGLPVRADERPRPEMIGTGCRQRDFWRHIAGDEQCRAALCKIQLQRQHTWNVRRAESVASPNCHQTVSSSGQW